MHYGNIGSFAAGLAALIAALFAVYGVIKYGPPWLRDSRARQQAQAAAANEESHLAREQAEQIALERRRHLYGWSRGTVDTFTVALVASGEEMDQARGELTGGGPSGYVVLRVAESDEKYGNVNRALRPRQIIESEGLISRPPTPGEREALEAGLKALGIPAATSG